MRFYALITAVLLGLTVPAFAVEPDEVLQNPALEARARAIGAELRCLVCQNESIDASHAPLAHDLRLLVRAHLQAGESDAQIRDFIVARYGDYVLLEPPFVLRTWVLWLATPILLLAGSIGLLLARRRGTVKDSAPLTMAEEADLTALLRQTDSSL